MSRCTVIIPTRDRPALVREAVGSALAQTATATEVLVIDDGSGEPLVLAAHPRLRIVRLLRSRGVSAARNLGIALATTPYVTFLDDDDRLRPRLVERSLEVLEETVHRGPVAALSGVAVVDEAGRVLEVRMPPALRLRGAHFSLEPIDPDRSYFSKQTLVVPREALLAVAGFDEAFRSRVVTELFLRLNPVCTLVGIPEVLYELRRHPGPRISTDRSLRRHSFRQLRAAHRDLLEAHPEGYGRLLAEHARTSVRERLPLEAAWAVGQHLRLDPRATLGAALRTLSRAPAPMPAAPADGCAGR